MQPEQLGTTRIPVSLGSVTHLPTALALLGLLVTLGLMLRGHKVALLYGIMATTAVAVSAKWLAPGLTVSQASGVADLRHFRRCRWILVQLGRGSTSPRFIARWRWFAARDGRRAAGDGDADAVELSRYDGHGSSASANKPAWSIGRASCPKRRVLVIDSLATAVGGLFGISALTTYIESAAGVAAGARTGLASIVTGLCFLLALGVTPFVGLIPPEATAPALIIVGFLMFQTVREIDFGSLGDGFSALLTLVLIPLTCSITNGIGVGVIVYVL
ncbi:MAG: NCS2 family permease [Kouleothrix sp.]|nr:NCS2 family permease [Kouleothrix sp.]